MKHTIEELRELQSLPLNRKIQITQTRIIEACQRWQGKAYISFSGGKDSTVLLNIARQIYPEIKACYVDTGLEYPEIKEFVKSFPNVDIVRPKMSFRQVIERYGYPVASKDIAQKVRLYRAGSKRIQCYFDANNKSRYAVSKRWKVVADTAPFEISERCCDVMKKSPAHTFERQTNLHPITAQMAQESQLRTQKWIQNGCNKFDNKHPRSNPMSFWTEQDILHYIKNYRLPYCSVYGDIVEDKDGKLKMTGCDRTGCVFCAFGAHLEKSPNRFEKLKRSHPQLWDYCMRPWNEGGLGMKEVLDFCDIPTGDEMQLTFEDLEAEQ